MSNLLRRQKSVTSINGSWIVPQVEASQENVYSATWVGIGGYGESSLIQTGTLQGVRDGEMIYYAWYELLPNTAVRIHSLHVEPGDRMAASVTLVDEVENLWRVEIHDLTNGEEYARTFSYTASRSSAEWIVERPSVGGMITTLADFGSVTFTDGWATINNATGAINTYPGYQLVMYDNTGELVRVSQFGTNGSSFTIDYLGPYGSQPH